MPKVFDELWAVVLYDYQGGGRRILWSTRYRAWLPSTGYGVGFTETPVVRYDVRPQAEDLSGVTDLVDVFVENGVCQRCGLSELGEHFVAPDVFGITSLYCVQQPDPRVVGSFGGGGNRKHWASRFGCPAVRPEYFTGREDDRWVDYGEGLIASHVRDWGWCSRCAGAANNLAGRARSVERAPCNYVRENDKEAHIRQFPYAR